MTVRGKTPGEPEPAAKPTVPKSQRLAEENWRELQDDPYDPYDLLFPTNTSPGV